MRAGRGLSALIAFFPVALSAGLGACAADAPGSTGDDDDTTPTVDADRAAPDAAPAAPDAGSGGPTCAALPSPAHPDTQAYQMDVVGKLSGHVAIAPGVTLDARVYDDERGYARDFLADSLTALGLFAQLQDYGTGANVWARIPADAPPPGAPIETIVLGAHYDTVYGAPGANDNATGVALVLAVARHLLTVDCRARDVIVVLFDEEEYGLLGSHAFAQYLQANVPNVVSVHTVDQMGWDGDDDRAIELERGPDALVELYAEAVLDGAFTIPLVETDTGSTDHVSFRPYFQAIGVTEEYVGGDTTPYYHQPGDRYETVDFPYLESTTNLVSFLFARNVRL